MGGDILDGVGDGVLVHLLADAHGVEGLEEQVDKGLVGGIFAIDGPR